VTNVRNTSSKHPQRLPRNGYPAILEFRASVTSNGRASAAVSEATKPGGIAQLSLAMRQPRCFAKYHTKFAVSF
jgi:hypothetical protein